jgi:hypothetical protein
MLVVHDLLGVRSGPVHLAGRHLDVGPDDGAVRIERLREGLLRDAEADGPSGHAHQRIARDAVEAQAVQVQHAIRRQDHPRAVRVRHAVLKRAGLLIALGARPIRRHQPQLGHSARHVLDDLGVAVAPRQRVSDERLAKRERRHLRVRPVVQQPGDLPVLFLTALRGLEVHAPRQRGDRLRDDPHARPEGRVGERGVFGDAHARLHRRDVDARLPRPRRERCLDPGPEVHQS